MIPRRGTCAAQMQRQMFPSFGIVIIRFKLKATLTDSCKCLRCVSPLALGSHWAKEQIHCSHQLTCLMEASALGHDPFPRLTKRLKQSQRPITCPSIVRRHSTKLQLTFHHRSEGERVCPAFCFPLGLTVWYFAMSALLLTKSLCALHFTEQHQSPVPAVPSPRQSGPSEAALKKKKAHCADLGRAQSRQVRGLMWCLDPSVPSIVLATLLGAQQHPWTPTSTLYPRRLCFSTLGRFFHLFNVLSYSWICSHSPFTAWFHISPTCPAV